MYIESTIKTKEDQQKRIFQAKNLITKRFSAVKRECGLDRKIKHGTLVRTVEEVKDELNLKNFAILPKNIR